MKKLLYITLITIYILLGQVVFSQSISYEMVSYQENNKDASTPFLNLAFFNKPYFEINFQSFKSGWQFLFDLVIGISIATAVIVFMLAAFNQIVNGKGIKVGSFGEIQTGNQGMWNAIVGLMIVLSAWLIINTINPDLLNLPMFQNLDKLGEQHTDPNQNGNVVGESNGS